MVLTASGNTTPRASGPQSVASSESGGVSEELVREIVASSIRDLVRVVDLERVDKSKVGPAALVALQTTLEKSIKKVDEAQRRQTLTLEAEVDSLRTAVSASRKEVRALQERLTAVAADLEKLISESRWMSRG